MRTRCAQTKTSHAKTLRGRRAYESGMSAENRISSDYERRGYPVAAQRWRGQSGEIDLIARDGDGLVFVEVKQSRSFDQALSHLTPPQVTRLYAAVEEYVANEPKGMLTDVRFDVALVNQQGEFRILENAFA